GSAIAVVSFDTSFEFIMRYHLHNLRKDCAPLIHAHPPCVPSRIGSKNSAQHSNRLADLCHLFLYASVNCGVLAKPKPDSTGFHQRKWHFPCGSSLLSTPRQCRPSAPSSPRR